MSHQEKIERINAELNTSETWSQRWQIEREHNERLAAEAEKVRAGILELKARAMQRYNYNQQYTAFARNAADKSGAGVYDRMCHVENGRLRALDDVLQLMDTVSKEP